MWAIAFVTRLPRTCRSRTGSTSIDGSSVGNDARSVTPAPTAAGWNAVTTSLTRRAGSIDSRASASVPGLGQGEGAQVLDEPLERPDLVERGLEARGVGGVDAIGHALEAALDHRQRRPQLVRHIGEEASTLSLVRVEPLAHRVERSRERAHGPGPGLGHPHGEIALLDPPGGVDQLVDGRREAPDPTCDADDQEQADHDGGDRHEAHQG